MMQNERPITRPEEDKLERAVFSKNLAKSILEWDGEESLVLSLNGKWGSGKSSVINLVKGELCVCSSSRCPTVIEFNPWFFSGEEKLNEHFFDEISKELSLKNSPERDEKIAKKLRLYSSVLCLAPGGQDIAEIIKSILIFLAFLGMSVNVFFSRMYGISTIASGLILAFSAFMLIVSFIKKILNSLAALFDSRGDLHTKSAMAIKDDLKKHLRKRQKKILIIMDDIDRLTPEEVRTLFKLIKVNSDFPNVIYLLSYDSEIIKQSLEKQEGTNGQEYLEKIVQISFDIPMATRKKIEEIFADECNALLAKLPNSLSASFDAPYWRTIYHSGLKHLFKNIRDVKRYISSLEFNISLLCSEYSTEVNPVDFMAIEAIRVFAPKFYHFMKFRKVLFTSAPEMKADSDENLRAEIELELDKLPEHIRPYILGLVSNIFPGIGRVLHRSYIFQESLSDYIKKQRACSPKHFDAYFTLVPGGSEVHLSQLEIDTFLSNLNDKERTMLSLTEFVQRKKIDQLLERLQTYTSDDKRILKSEMPTLVQALFDLSDTLPSEDHVFLGFGPKRDCTRIVLQLLKRNENKEENSELIQCVIKNSIGIAGVVDLVYILVTNRTNVGEIIPAEHIEAIRNACVDKISNFATCGKLESNSNFALIMFRWKEWSSGSEWLEYLTRLLSSDGSLISALRGFVSVMTISSGSGSSSLKYFDFKQFDEFISCDDIKPRLEKIRDEKGELYSGNKDIVDMFLDNFRFDPRG